MTELTIPNVAEQPRAREALERVRPEFLSIDKNSLLQINLDPLIATATVQGALPKFMALRPQILAEIPSFNIAYLDKVETYALALLNAHTLHLIASMPPEAIAALADEAVHSRELLLADAFALSKRGYIKASVLQDLKGPVGFHNIASDTLTLVAIIRGIWDTASTKTGITSAELDRAEVVGEHLVRAIGLRAQGPTTLATAALERQQAFTLFINAYNQVRRVVHFIRWDEDDADDIAPSLYAGRTAKKKTVPTSEGTATTAAGTAPATAVASAAPATPTANNATAKPVVGLPGADPFAN